MSVIALSHITKDYGGGHGVFDVSFAVEQGEVFGFLGPNGAGKTTTIRQLMGFLAPDSGTCTINGLDCRTQTAAIQKNMGYIPGEPALPDDMPICDEGVPEELEFEGDAIPQSRDVPPFDLDD